MQHLSVLIYGNRMYYAFIDRQNVQDRGSWIWEEIAFHMPLDLVYKAVFKL